MMGKARHASASDIVMCGMFTALMAVGAFIKIMIPLRVLLCLGISVQTK